VDDLKKVIRRVLAYLRSNADFSLPDCSYVRALDDAVRFAELSAMEVAAFDYTKQFANWGAVGDTVVSRLLNKYSALLDIRIDGELPDHLMWDVVDVAGTYGRAGLQPDCEHLCIALLAIEGCLPEIASANWDGLIEKAVDELAGPRNGVLTTYVRPEDFRGRDPRSRLMKFHGCAVLASGNPAVYRPLLIGRVSQIEGWTSDPNSAVMRQQLIGVAVIRPTLMVGLSAQDLDIRDLFNQAKVLLHWEWPSSTPAHVFAEETLGHNQNTILSCVYRDAYDKDPRAIQQSAQFRAFAKPLFVGLVLHVLCTKLAALARCAHGALFSATEFDRLGSGIRSLRNKLAGHGDVDRTGFIRSIIAELTRALGMLRGDLAGTRYLGVSIHPLGQISSDPGNNTSGLPELAAVIGILGLGEQRGDWAVHRADPSTPSSGALIVMPAGGATPQRVFFVANTDAALQLNLAGAVTDHDSDAIVVCSTIVAQRPRRSPRGKKGRTGIVDTRHFSMRALLRQAADLTEFQRLFRQAATL
jgi:hypothetical protein